MRAICDRKRAARYFAVLVEPRNNLHALYNSLSREEGISHSIDTVRDYHAPWVRDWLKVISENKDMIMAVRYEDLNRDTKNTLKKAFRFFNIKPEERLLDSLAASKIIKEVDLEAALKKDLPGRLRSTARKGVVGDWKNYFTEAHKKRFKDVAGDVLVSLGYEKDYNW